MTKIEQYINAQCARNITDQLVYMDCSHEWYEHGPGYKCHHCYYYTGTNDILNKEIEKSLTQKK